MASVTYGMCYLWQRYYAKCNYGKSIIATETEPTRSSYQLSIGNIQIIYSLEIYIFVLKCKFPGKIKTGILHFKQIIVHCKIFPTLKETNLFCN